MKATRHSTTCPQAIRADLRKERNVKRLLKPEQKKARKAWCVGRKCACGCGRDANTPHHPSGDLYETDERYFNLDNCIPYYHICHGQLHKGYVPCEKCGKLIKPGFTLCWNCRDAKDKEESERKKIHWRNVRRKNEREYRASLKLKYSSKQGSSCPSSASSTLKKPSGTR